MTPERIFRFATAEQWGRCLRNRLEVSASGLIPAPHWALRPRPVTGSGPNSVTIVAAASGGMPLWRAGGGQPQLQRFGDDDLQVTSFEIDGVLAASPRWVVTRSWLWGFDPGRAFLVRHDRETLRFDRSLALSELSSSEHPALARGRVTAIDIASDGSDGLWILLQTGGTEHRLMRVDCRLRLSAEWALPREICQPTKLGSMLRGGGLALLHSEGRWLDILDSKSGQIERSVAVWAQGPLCRAEGIATDLGNRLALWGPAAHTNSADWALTVLDAAAEWLAQPVPADVGVLPAALQGHPRDVALSTTGYWLATDAGLWSLERSGQASTQATSSLLTPALESPEIDDSGGGWLHAELRVSLPPGAAIEFQIASTSDHRAVVEAERIAADRSLPVQQRLTAIWQSLPDDSKRTYRTVGPSLAGTPPTVPLFEANGRWLWLRLEVVTPAGVAPPALQELRILRARDSIAQNLPAIFRGKDNDPSGFLRRLVGVLEATSRSIDHQIQRAGRYLDPDRTELEWLDYLARWLALPWDDGLPEGAKRSLLRNAGPLLEWRGTRKGLRLLLGAILGPRDSVAIVDVTVDHHPMRLGRDGTGVALPALLAGRPAGLAVLSGKARVGSARLPCPSTSLDPLATLVPEVRIGIVTNAATAERLRSIVPLLLAVYLPVDLRWSVTWRTSPDSFAARELGEGMVLEAPGPGVIGESSRLGRTVLAGRRGERIDDGFEMGSRLI